MRSLRLGSGLSNDRTRWYRDAKFGMFIHWGPYSLASLLAGGQSLKFRQTERRLQIDLPQQPPDPNVTVIAVRTL